MIRTRIEVLLVLLFLASNTLAGENLINENNAEFYDASYCETCHGAFGIGNEGVQAPRIAGLEPWYLERQLKSFRDGLRGSHDSEIDALGMRAIASKMSDKNIGMVIKTINQWQTEGALQTVIGNVDVGEKLYSQCAVCHGEKAEGKPALGAPALAGQSDWYLVNQLEKFKQALRGNNPKDQYGAQMLTSVETITDTQSMVDVVSYINTL